MAARFSPLTQVAFHPSRAVLIFSDESNIDSRIWVWEFGAAMTIGSIQHEVPSPTKRLNFSSCGDYILVDGVSLTRVIPMPKTMSSEVNPKAEPRNQTEAFYDTRSDDSLCKIGNLDVSSYNLKAGQVLKGSILGKVSGSSPFRVSAVGLSDVVSISTDFGISPQVLQITRLPQWLGIENTAPSIKIPFQGDNIITAVLNKAAKA